MKLIVALAMSSLTPGVAAAESSLPGDTAATWQTVGAALTWSPPPSWQNYRPVTIQSSGGVITLPSNAADYRIVAPEIVRGAVTLRGGRNVVWIGGHIRIDRNDAANGKIIQATARRGLLVDDGPAEDLKDGRVVFIEGLRLDGDDLSEGIDIKAPKAHVVIQNIGIDVVRLRGFDDRDSTGAYARNSPIKNHSDLLQPFGGFKTLCVDGLSGRTGYQGLFFVTDVRIAPGGSFELQKVDTTRDVWLRRMDITAIETADETDPGIRHAGHTVLAWYGDGIGQMFIDSGTVWFQPHVNSARAADGQRRIPYRDPSGTVQFHRRADPSEFINNFKAGPTYPTRLVTGPYAAVTGSDATGVYATWSDAATLADGRPAVRDWTGRQPGRIYSGVPPGGGYVPLTSVGLDYRSPGYIGASRESDPDRR